MPSRGRLYDLTRSDPSASSRRFTTVSCPTMSQPTAVDKAMATAEKQLVLAEQRVEDGDVDTTETPARYLGTLSHAAIVYVSTDSDRALDSFPRSNSTSLAAGVEGATALLDVRRLQPLTSLYIHIHST